jgi:hypothetical protein
MYDGIIAALLKVIEERHHKVNLMEQAIFNGKFRDTKIN